METKTEVLQELQKIPWFKEIKPELLQKIVAIAHLRPIKLGEILFREGDKEDFLYIVIEGRIALDIFIPHRGKLRIYTVEPWDLFGWSSVTPAIHQRTAGATAVLDGLVVAIDSSKLRQACEEDHELGYLVMRRLMNIVAGRLLVTRLQLIDMFASPEETNAN
ncbi:MAG: Crp/Fnr family transcriptional regulator [Anaerolineales bacterium]|nr:Crp/Fnr family transcriptional regulator [Anaerolineales bacterium]